MALNKKKVIIAIAALAVIGGIGIATGNSTTEEATAPAAPAPAATTEAPAPATAPPAPATASSSPAESSAPAEEAAPVEVTDDADPADIETVLSGFPGDGEGYSVLDSAATDHAEGTVVGLEVETPEGTIERGVWILFTNGSVQAANAETVKGSSASWPVRKDAPYALDDEVISVDMSLGAD